MNRKHKLTDQERIALEKNVLDMFKQGYGQASIATVLKCNWAFVKTTIHKSGLHRTRQEAFNARKEAGLKFNKGDNFLYKGPKDPIFL